MKIPPKELFLYLYKENNKVILFDDADEFFYNKTSINILKKVLDSSKSRKLGYGSKPVNIRDGSRVWSIPSNFLFTGKVIIITNMYFKDMDKAIVSRSLVAEIDLSAKECLKRIERLLPFLIKKVAIPYWAGIEVLNHLKTLEGFYTKLDLRTLEQSLRERIRNPKTWKKFIKNNIILKRDL